MLKHRCRYSTTKCCFLFVFVYRKERFLSLIVCHFGEFSDTFIPRRRIFSGERWEVHSVSISNDISRCSIEKLHFKLKQCT